jgi:UDP-GlcNAc:undecaprenyl-phosphate GlcNAc-1-phosphate transferase
MLGGDLKLAVLVRHTFHGPFALSSAMTPLLLAGAFLTALSLSLMGTFVIRGWAHRRGYVDVPDNGRRIHTKPTPNIGGVAVVFASVFSFGTWSIFVVPGDAMRPEIVTMLFGGILIFAVGFWDDTRPLRASTKFGLQMVVAAITFAGGVRIMGVGFGGLWTHQLTGLMGYAVTSIWIVGTTNAFNLIDGSDGVAGGAALFAALSMGVIFALNGDPLGALMATILAGACLGFLYFNFPPATVFMGDCGSLFLGYTLATLGVITTQQSSTLIAVAIPVIAFGVPLLDTAIAIVRRYLRQEPIFAPDRGHIHHRLGDQGSSPRRVAILLYVACAGCASLSMLLAAPGRSTVLPVFIVAGTVLILGVLRLKLPELTELTRVVGRGFQQRSVISHNVRLHVASGALSTAKNGRDVVDILKTAFRGSEFSRIVIWVPGGLSKGWAEDELVLVGDDGCRLTIGFETSLHPEQEVEVRVPILSNGETVGRLSFYRTPSGSRLFTDIRLVSSLLSPALADNLQRLSGGPDRSESQGLV